MNGQLHNFFLELWNRIRARSPKFFRVVQLFLIIVTGLGYAIPYVFPAWFNIELTGNFETMCKDLRKYAMGGFLLSQLPVSSSPVAKTEEGTILKTTDEKTMPYTAAQEVKNEGKKAEELPVVPSADINKV
jgi:hypothetical protein